jgi:hypothetical protein
MIQIDIDSLIDKDRPFQASMANTGNTTVGVTLSMTVAGEKRSFSWRNSPPADEHADAVGPFGGRAGAISDWGTGASGDPVKVSMKADDGTTAEATGRII